MRHVLAAAVTALLAFPALAQEKAAQDKAELGKLQRAAEAAVQQQDWATAAASFRKVTELDAKNGKAWHMLGYCLHAEGKLDEALPIHIKATAFADVAPTAAYNAACVYALKGDKDQAFAWLDKAVGYGFQGTEYLDNDTDLDNLRQDPRFAKVVEKVKTAAPKGGEVMVFAPTTDRKCARVAFFSRNGSPGQLAIDYGPVDWKDQYDAAIEDPKMVGKKWRLGRDYWTSLDTSLDLQIGGVDIPAGYYYLTATSLGNGKFVLGVHDAAAVRKAHLDAFVADKLQGGIEVPLTHGTKKQKQEQLAIAINLSGEQTKGTLSIEFGGHVLTAPVVIKL